MKELDRSRANVIGWWEEYKCGCTSETVRFKKDLVGYCGKHGADRRHVYPEFKEPKGGGR